MEDECDADPFTPLDHSGDEAGDVTWIEIPGYRVHPGIWVASFMCLLVALGVATNSGLKYGIPPLLLAFALPLIYYLNRTASPRCIELDRSKKTITMVFTRLGRSRRTRLETEKFESVYSCVTSFRYPHALVYLRLRRPEGGEIQIADTDCVRGEVDSDGCLQSKPVPEIELLRTTLEKYFGIKDLGNNPSQLTTYQQCNSQEGDAR